MGKAAEQVSYAEKVRRFQERASWLVHASLLVSFARLEPGASVLDFGCGPGKLCRYLASKGYQVTGVDVSDDMLDMARKSPVDGVRYENINPKIGLTYEREFDAIFCLHVLGHVDDLDVTLQQFRVALRPGGRVLVLNPNLLHTLARRPIDWVTGYKADPTIKRRFTLGQFTQLMALNGFSREWSFSVGEPFFSIRPLFAASYIRHGS